MIYSKLSNLMKRKRLTITKLANDTGISRTTLTSLFHNTGNGIQFDTLNVLCKYFNISINELLVFVPYTVEIKLEDIGEDSFISTDDYSECMNKGRIIFTNVGGNEQASYSFTSLITVLDNADDVTIECDIDEDNIFAYQEFIAHFSSEVYDIIMEIMMERIEETIQKKLSDINNDWHYYNYNTFLNYFDQWDKWEIYNFLFYKMNGTK